MKENKKLMIRGTLLDKNQIASHLEKTASEHSIKRFSNKDTYPINRLIDDYKFILETYQLLNKHLKLGIKIHSAGEWILDNFYIIEETYKTVQKELNLKKYQKLNGLANDNYYGFSRIYVLAEEIVAFSDSKIDRDLIDLALKAYQKKKVLTMEEISSIGIFFKISLIANIRRLCEKIYFSEIQKYKVEEMIERIIERKNNSIFSEIKPKIKINNDDLKYSFIEYMSYKLKLYGKSTIEYQNILEKEVEKIGLTISEVIQKEHFNIANIKISLGNCITSIKEINRINFVELYSYMSVSEEILNKDPSLVYPLMDEESKNYYRNIIGRIAKKNKISEVYISEKIISLCKKYENSKDELEKKKSHVGYYLITKDGKRLLNKELEIYNRSSKINNAKLYIGVNFGIPIYICLILYFIFFEYSKNISASIIFSILMFIPISEIFFRIENYILGKVKSPTIIPKLNFEKGIPDRYKTMVVIPTILKSKEKVQTMFEKLEVYYLANKSDNLYFCLLGDCTEEDTKQTDFDSDIITSGLEICEKLNKKYPNSRFNRFHFIYRERVWNESEMSYIGWERKRGLLYDFNLYIKGLKNNNFLENTIEKNIENIPNIKYVITLDSDTSLDLGSAAKLIGAMGHILNKPVIKNNRVIDGYGIMQPRIGMDLVLSYKSLFIELYSMKGGIDCYTNAISDIYQDYFKEGIFTGKGIYDVEIYNKILEDEFPENTVLSHDLLEGNFLRCGLLTDVILLDGYPAKYIAYILRNHRWTRGDWQIIKWLKCERLNSISKFKIYDNLRRSLIQVASLLFLILGIVNLYNLKNIFFIISLVSITVPYIIDIINYIIFKESNVSGAVYAYKKFSKELKGIEISAIRIILQIAFLPYEAIKNLDSIIRSLYRMKHKTKLLEWVTAEDGENKVQSNIKYYYKEMYLNCVFGIIFLVSNFAIFKILGILWIISPIIAWYISRENISNLKIEEDDRRYLIEIAKRTWEFFESYITEENNYLMPDNYQEDRTNKVVNRTSSTNIGLELLVIISAYDLGFINFKKTIEYLRNIFNSIVALNKWNGHLYNWYSTDTLMPLIPRYVSTVDSGNFIGYLYIVKRFLEENKNKADLENLINIVNELIANADFKELYSDKNKLLSIGFNLEENRLTDSYYDFLASEARQASFIAIAKGDIPYKHWNNLSRTLTSLYSYKGLISWTGTAFEYLMPNVNLNRYKGSLLDESSKFAIMSQIEYCKKLDVPWGISESTFNLKDLNNNYQYKAFGIPWLGLKRGLEEDIVISPYSTFLSLEDELKEGIKNLKVIERDGGTGKYGFYESIDYTPKRIKNNKKVVVKTYMAHHQGLIFLSLNNILNDNILKKRFNHNPEIEAANILLQERMPVQMIITKENKEKISKNKYTNYNLYTERVIENSNKTCRNINVISNEKYKITIDDLGNSISEYKNLMVNNYKITSELKQGVNFYIKNLKNKKIIDASKDCKVVFAPDKVKFIKRDNNFKIEEIVFIDPNRAIEIRKIEIENLGNSDEVIEIICDFEPSLSEKMQEYSHPAFNKLFTKLNEENEIITFEKINREKETKTFLATTLYTENEQIVDFEYEIDKEKYLGRENLGMPQIIKEQKGFSKDIKQVTDPIIAMKRTVKIRRKKIVNLNFIISVSENKEKAIENLENIKSEEEIIRLSNIARARAEEECKYLQLDGDKICMYTEFLKYLLGYVNIIKKEKENLSINNLWKYGISGDNPIIFVKIRSVEYVYVIDEVIDLYGYYRAKRIVSDLIIIVEEKDDSKEFIINSVNDAISNKQLNFLKDINGGIFVLDKENLLDDEYNVIEFKARIIIDTNNGDLKWHLKKLNLKTQIINKDNQEYLVSKESDSEIYPLKLDKIKYDNGYGGFLEEGKEYCIYKNKENTLPSVWCNILANNFFGTIITDNMGGYTWSKNSRLNRITAWNNDRVTDLPSEIIYIKDEKNKEVWTVNSGVIPNRNYYYITNGFGYSKIKNINDNFNQDIEVFVPNGYSMKIIKFRIKNLINESRKIKLLYYIKTVLGEDEFLTNGNIISKKNNNVIYLKNVFSDESFKNRISYFTSDLEIKTYTGEKDDFIGNLDLLNPKALYEGLNNSNGLGKNSCLGLEFCIDFDKFEEKNFYFILGEEAEEKIIEDNLKKISNISEVSFELENVKESWNNLLSTIKIKTPIESLNIFINGWCAYQTISSRILGKTGYFQSGGAYGFRDQLQDCIGIKYIDSKYLKEQIINCARHQFIEGDVLHWWHNETKRGIRTRFSDDMLWLVYGVLEYIKYDNNYEFLDEKIEYLKGNVLDENELEKYDIYYAGNEKESLYEHCIKAIENTINKGLEPFPKIGVGDWNDGFNKIGAKGVGESIWLGFFLYDILNRFIPICELRNDEKNAQKYTNIKNKLKKDLNTVGWDGRWFKRAITDDGIEIGSINSEECRIDSISQSWSVISGAADNDKKYIAMQEVENYLIDDENKIIKLFDPPFEKSSVNPGYIKSYPPGIRENGGQYTHASCWVLIAEAILGFGNKAIEIANMLNPIEHSKNKEEAKKFKLEPYIIEADLYSNKDLVGRGGWNWYTGSSGWYYKAIIEYVLGLKIEYGYLWIDPNISKKWNEYEIQYKYKTSIYNIKVKCNGKENGVEKFIVNGKEIEDKKILLEDNGKIQNIEVIM